MNTLNEINPIATLFDFSSIQIVKLHSSLTIQASKVAVWWAKYNQDR